MTRNNKRNLPLLARRSVRVLAMLAATLVATVPVGAYQVTKTLICDASAETCPGNPPSDIYKVTIVDDNDGSTQGSFSMDWLVPVGTVGDTPLPVDLEASSTWTISSLTDSNFHLEVAIRNDTDLSGFPGTNSAITAFAFGVEPDSSVASFTAGSTFDDYASQNSLPNQKFSGGFKTIDICVFSDGCSGGNVNNGLQAGQQDTVKMVVAADNPGTYASNGNRVVELLFFPIKFQGTWGSFESGGSFRNGVPAPVPLAMIGLGLLWFRFRKAG